METAKYCYQAATILQKDFGQGEYKDISIIPDEVSEHYGCVVERTASNLFDKISSELHSGRPVISYFDDILSIKVVRNGHAAVFDGLAEVNNDVFVHVNFGWGGKSDGWYNYKTLSDQRKLLYIFSIRSL